MSRMAMWMASLICLPLYFVFRCRSRFYIRLFNVNVSRRDNWSLRLFTIIRSLVGEAGRTRNSLAHWEKKWEGGFRRGWGYPRRFIVNISRHSIIICGFRVLLFFLFCSCVIIRLLNSIHDEISNRRCACWFCLDFSLEIAAQTNRSKSMYKGNRRKDVCRLCGRQKHMYIAI